MRAEIELLLKNPRALGAQPHRVSNNRLDINLLKKSAVLTFTKIVLFSLYANAGRGNSVGFSEIPLHLWIRRELVLKICQDRGFS